MHPRPPTPLIIRMEDLSPFGSYIARYEGIGTLRLSARRQAKVAFDLRQLDSGDLVVACQTDRFVDVFDAESLVGSTTDGRTLRIENLEPVRSTVRSQGINHGISYGRTATITSLMPGQLPQLLYDFSVVNLVLPTWTLQEGAINLETQDHKFRIRPIEGYRDVARQLSGLSRTSGVRITARSRVRRKDGRPLTVDEAIDATDELCLALSLCTGAKVNWITAENGQWYRRHAARVTKGYSSWIYNLDWTLSPQRALTAWSRNANRDYFGAMVDYFIDAAGRGPYIETRALTAASLLDAITGEYSRLSHIEKWVDDSTWSAARPNLVAAIDQAATSTGVAAPLSRGVDGLQRRSLRSRLRHLFRAHNLPAGRLQDIIEVRNDIVHYGRFPSNCDHVIAYELVLWTSFVVLARLIGYRGSLPGPPP